MSALKKAKIGVVGCGAISAAYFKTLKALEITEVVACADLFPEAAKKRAEEFEVPRVYSVDELLADPEIEIVINLTIPGAHAEVDQKILQAGKHPHSEKPFAVTREDGKKVLALAKQKGLRVGCAPDTFLGGGHQTARRLIDEGAIGEVVSVTAFMQGHGHESWHPNPEFYYKAGGGPMFDMGPYYLTAMVNMIGPVKRVTGMTRVTFKERTVTSQPRAGQVIKVEVPTHVTGLLEFQNGAVGTIIQSFDVWGHSLPNIEVHGTEGSMRVPDPNGFGGQVFLRLPGQYQGWVEATNKHRYNDGARGLGAADMAYGLRSGRPHRVSGELAFHVLDIMQTLHESSDQGKHLELGSTCARPAAIPVGLKDGTLDP
ncbi:MAG: Gfo/Idh/MocA family oxidoreductase [Planctomycetes bacterium]|nr:Gfo/Idh/MocA family oxidoreductase [Planctomycetota bacterium]